MRPERPEDLVLHVVASGGNALPALPLEWQLKSCASQASDAQDAQDAKNNFCGCRKFRNEVRGIGAGHGAKPSVVDFLAGKGDSLPGEGDNSVSAVNNSVMGCEVGHSKENVIVV